MKSILRQDFFDRPATRVARDLLGKYLVRKIGTKDVALMITETEAYLGPNDKASHARFGEKGRSAPMWQGPGTIYVYFCYGVHWMLNIVVGKKGEPGAVLIRGVESPEKTFRSGEINKTPTPARTVFPGLKDSAAFPAKGKKGVRLGLTARSAPFLAFAGISLNGPGKLTKFLNIDKKLNVQLLGKKSGLWIEDRGVVLSAKEIKKGPRVGVDYAGPYAAKPWRFVLERKL